MTVRAIGLISGTSMDGIDAAAVEIADEPHLQTTLHTFLTRPYPPAVRDALLAVAGRLDGTMGGPAYRDLATPRRTLYLMTIRSDRTGFGPLFDVADPTAPVDKRTVSTVVVASRVAVVK